MVKEFKLKSSNKYKDNNVIVRRGFSVGRRVSETDPARKVEENVEFSDNPNNPNFMPEESLTRREGGTKCRVGVLSSPISTHPNLPSLGKKLFSRPTGEGRVRGQNSSDNVILRTESEESLTRRSFADGARIKLAPAQDDVEICHSEGEARRISYKDRGQYMPQTRAKFAFTLAEVLITLGIIGVVAAMTIPGLMSKIQWLVLKQQYKEVYSTLNQALKLIYEKTDTVYNCYYGTTWKGATCIKRDENGECTEYEKAQPSNSGSGECGKLYDELKEVLKVSTICQNQAYQNKCIPKYKGLDSIYKDNHKDNYTDYDVTAATSGCSRFRESNILTTNTAWVLIDGTIIGFYGYAPEPFTKIFFADINGVKGPNKWGYDLHAFMIMGDGENKLWVAPGGCGMIEKGGKSGAKMLE